MPYDIFISYRRQGGAQYARILKAELEKRGYRDRVFLDFDGLTDGRFDNRIMQAIDSAKIFIFILSPGALDRCINEDDWVRKEILYAIEHEKHIVPVNFDGLFKDFPPSIPVEIRQGLGQHQFSDISSGTLHELSIDKLIKERISPLIDPTEQNLSIGGNAEITIISDADCSVNLFGKAIAQVKADHPTPLHLKKGNYPLEFVSSEIPDVVDRIKYTVPDNNYFDSIEVKLKERVLDATKLFPISNIGNTTSLWGINIEDEKWGFKDIKGNIVIPFKFDAVRGFDKDLARVKMDGKWGVINKVGNIIIPFEYECIYDFNEGLAIVIQHGKYGSIDKSGVLVVPCIYEDARMCFFEGLLVVKHDGKWGFVDTTGNVVIPCKYDSVSSFSEGLAAVRLRSKLLYRIDKWGYVNKSGKLIIPCKYDKALEFLNGKAEVEVNGRRFYIDKTGKEVRYPSENSRLLTVVFDCELCGQKRYV